MKKKVLRVLGFNMLLLIIASLIYSERMLGKVSDNYLNAFLHFTAAFGLLAAFIGGNHLILHPPRKLKLLDNGRDYTSSKYIKALEYYSFKSDLFTQINTLIFQVKRLEAKRQNVFLFLSENFEPGEMTYNKFSETVESVCAFFFSNVKNAVNLIAVFDEDEFKGLRSGKMYIPNEIKPQKEEIFQEQFRQLGFIINQNEEIITMLDKLSVEVSALGQINNQPLENITALKDMNELIQNTRFYRSQEV